MRQRTCKEAVAGAVFITSVVIGWSVLCWALGVWHENGPLIHAWILAHRPAVLVTLTVAFIACRSGFRQGAIDARRKILVAIRKAMNRAHLGDQMRKGLLP